MNVRPNQQPTLFQQELEGALCKAHIDYKPGNYLATRLRDGRRMIFMHDGEAIPLVLGYMLVRDRDSGAELKKEGRTMWLDGHPNYVISDAFLMEMRRVNKGHGQNHYIVLVVGDSAADKESFEDKLERLNIREGELCGEVRHTHTDGRWTEHRIRPKEGVAAYSVSPDSELAGYLVRLKRECAAPAPHEQKRSALTPQRLAAPALSRMPAP